MTAYLSAVVTIKDRDQFKIYAAKAMPIIAEFGGELVATGKLAKVLAGSAHHHAASLFAFPDVAAIEKWFASEAYQAIIPIRDAGADVVVTILQGPEPRL